MLKVSNILKTFKTNQSDEQQPGPSHQQPRNSTEDDLEALLEEECQVDLKLKLLDLANTKMRLPVNTDIVKYWESRRYEDPQMYELAMIALSASATQVSVERCFSAIKLLLEQHRLRMSPKMLDDLMTIRFNRDLLPAAISKFQHIH